MLKKGVTVLVCTHNGGKNLPATLQHLAGQQTDATLQWEILVVNNASTDDTRAIAINTWNDLRCTVPFTVVDEMRPGKDKAVDLGLATTSYSYLVICDDDNWLSENYVQYAYHQMESNPSIGVLGGRGIAALESGPPDWFPVFETYYAIGKQYAISGEIRPFWPVYRFLWGAGAVINVAAYRLLQRSGFERILTYEKVAGLARSEDLELCFAIWLAGYKLWYDGNLTYRHYISAEKLQWAYLLKVIRLSVSAMHYLRPYHILLFTGVKKAPGESFWAQYITYYYQFMRKHYRNFDDLKTWLRLLAGIHREDNGYMNKAIVWYQFLSVLKLGKRYDTLFKKVAGLQQAISVQTNTLT